MPEATPENANQDASAFSPLPHPTESADPSSYQNKKTLVIGGALVVVMLALVGVTFYTLRSGSSPIPSSSPAPSASVSSLSDQGLDQSVSQVNSDFSSIDKEVNDAEGGFSDKEMDLSY
jgi:hypothetical protein